MIYQNVFVPLPPMRLAAGFGKERFPIIREPRQAQTDEYTPKNRFSQGREEIRAAMEPKPHGMKHTYKKLKLSCLVVLGGNAGREDHRNGI